MITNTGTKETYEWDAGNPSPLSITFAYNDKADIMVFVNGERTTQFTIDDINKKVSFSSSYIGTIPDEANIVITRATPLTQTTQYENQGKVDLRQLERNLDKLTLISQENRGAMAEVDSRSEEIAENVASATAETISGSMQTLVGLAAENASNAYTYRNEASGYKNEALGYAGQAGSFCTTASGYMATANIAGSNALGYMGSAISAANSASAYKEQAYSHSISAGGYALSAGGYMSSAADYATAASGYADAASSAINVSAGNGISISGGYISAKVDSSTMGFNSNGELSCTVGQTYTAGDGIVISDGQIAATSTLLNDVKQVISSGAVVRGGSDGSGGYFFVTGSGATVGYGSGFRISVGASETAVKTSTATGMYLSGNYVTLQNSGKAHYMAGASSVIMYGGTSAVALRLNSAGVEIKHSGDDGYNRAVHVGMSATSDSVGVIQPDNSTCTVDSGGILHCVPYSAGSGITISGGVISADVDSSTVGFDTSGRISIASGIDYMIDSYINGTSWYRVWKSGWCEQGGQTNIASGEGNYSLAFLQEFSDTNYNFLCHPETTDMTSTGIDILGVYRIVGAVYSKSATGVQIQYDSSRYTGKFFWRAEGYLTQGD